MNGNDVAGLRRPAAALANFTQSAFGVIPMSLAMLVLRFALAIPFWRSGMTKWDGFLTVSFSAQALFADEYKLHLFGSQVAYPAPELAATVSALAETCLPALLVFGLGTRYAAFGLLLMTGIIQITVPDGWANFHLPWAAMALAIAAFGPGKISLDYLLSLDGSAKAPFEVARSGAFQRAQKTP